MSLKLFDSHAHYDDGAFDGDRFSLIESLGGSGVSGIINPGCNVESSTAAAQLAEKYPFIWFAPGIHPEDAGTAQERDIDSIARLAAKDRAVAIGEIGLDYHYDEPSREIQKHWFEKQLSLANGIRKPVIIHDRDAHADTLELIKKYRPAGVVHCFSGSAEMAVELVKLGFYLGFTGVITFKNARRAAEAVRVIPIERILIETDSPYMAPEPFRGKRCDSSMVVNVLTRIAEIKGISNEEASERIYRNTLELFKII